MFDETQYVALATRRAPLFAVAKRHLNPCYAADLEDVVQEALTRAWEGRHAVHTSTFNFVYTVAMRTAMNWCGSMVPRKDYRIRHCPDEELLNTNGSLVDPSDSILDELCRVPERTLQDIEALVNTLSAGKQQTYADWRARGFGAPPRESPRQYRDQLKVSHLKTALVRKATQAAPGPIV